jgi:hypothetical protein
MRLEPRQQLLDIWQSVVRMCWRGGAWEWGGRLERNSIADAEQLLCLLLPATQLGHIFAIDFPDDTSEEILETLSGLGNQSEIPRRLTAALAEYFDAYSVDERPVFSGGSYFGSHQGPEAVTDEQRHIDVVDSYAMSITLSLAAIGFARVFQTAVTREELRTEVRRVADLASRRLTAAMVGLLRSFTIQVYDLDSAEGRILLETVNTGGDPVRIVGAALRQELRQTMAAFREVMIGSGQLPALDVLDSPTRLFQCGWSWGIVEHAPEVEVGSWERVGPQPKGVAPDTPLLYSTVIVMDAIEDLWSERTRILGLLNEEQQRLARALQLRHDLTRQYWATVATFGDGVWPVEDIPWRATDGTASDYYTLLVTSLLVKGFVLDRSPDPELVRVGELLGELASRGRITRRPMEDDPAAALHAPGHVFDLEGSEIAGGPRLTWRATEFTPLLLLRTATIAGLVSSATSRGRLLDLADRIWDHLERRRLDSGSGRALWDQPSNIFPLDVSYDAPSWYYTQRVVHGLVAVARALDRAPVRSDLLVTVASELLFEAEHLLDRVMLNTPAHSRAGLRTVRARLDRAREIINDRPGTAAVLANEVLRQLEVLAVAVRDLRDGF